MDVFPISKPVEQQTGEMSTIEEFPSDDREVVPWLAGKPKYEQEELAKNHFSTLIDAAAQPRHISGNACLKLCHFVELCRKSSSGTLRDVAFSRDICMGLYTFFVEWSEKNLHRSTRQTIDLLGSLLMTNPDKSSAQKLKEEISERGIYIILGKSVQASVKPALKALEHLLSKRVLTTSDVLHSYQKLVVSAGNATGPETLHALVFTTMYWMSELMPETAPSAGKFLVAIFNDLKIRNCESFFMDLASPCDLWQNWINTGLKRYPNCLDNVKNYLLSSLFKFDKVGALDYLHKLSRNISLESQQGKEFENQSFLFLAALEVGKKAGLVIDANDKPTCKTEYTIMPEAIVGRLLGHPSSTLRSSAFAILIHSKVATRPFSASTLDILKFNMAVLYADTDAKFRNDILSNTKIMIERLRDSKLAILRDLDNLVKLAQKHQAKVTERSKLPNMSNITPHAADTEDRHLRDVLRDQDNFYQWFTEFLAGELVPTASYQRHITSLKAIQIIIVAAGHDATTTTIDVLAIYDAQFIRLLLDLIMDPFEDVRMTATSILKSAPVSVFSKNAGNGDASGPALPSSLTEFLSIGEEFSKRTGRADFADGVARTQELLFSLLQTENSRLSFVSSILDDLETRIEMAASNLVIAVLESPVHGQFASLRLIWEAMTSTSSKDRGSVLVTKLEPDAPEAPDSDSWTSMQHRMILCCHSIWSAVEAILCNDSPEGHVLMDVEDSSTIDTKDVLSYSFRAIHESSNLLRTIVNQSQPDRGVSKVTLPFRDFVSIGDLSFSQLANLRHRGAFSTVTLTFARCCQATQLYKFSEPESTVLLESWYTGTLACIEEQVSTTRRSAGIPALMTGVLAANAATVRLQDAMDKLMAFSREPVTATNIDETNLPQVHAMNCMKDILRNSTLSKRAEPYISDCLELAADTLQSNTWAIRNCGLILLRSLIDCLFGTNDSKLVTEAGWDGRSIKLSYDRYTALPELLLRLLSQDVIVGADGQAPMIGSVESVFPALDIIRRAGPPESIRKEVYSAVANHLSSKVWHIRDIAARTICTLHLSGEWHQDLVRLVHSCQGSTNRCHGVMLVLKYVLERRQALSMELLPEQLRSLLKSLDELEDKESYIQREALATFEEVNNMLLSILLNAQRRCVEGYENLEEDVILLCAGTSEETLSGSPSIPTALLSAARADKSFLIAALYGRIEGAAPMLEQLMREDLDTGCACLEHMTSTWPVETTPESELTELCKIYKCAVEQSKTPQIRSIATENIADILDKFPTIGDNMDMASFIGSHLGTPDLSNAQIRISGHVIRHRRDDEDQAVYDDRLTRWGQMLNFAGKAESDFDTRYAAVLALRAFYGSSKFSSLPTSSLGAHVLALIACYDALSDDDDEIRELSAEVASNILGTSLVSLAVKDRFLIWLAEKFGDSHVFMEQVLLRIMGTDQISAKEQLTLALIDDDALFVKEEQNLYVDEVRESIAWNSLLLRQGVMLETLTEEVLQWTLAGLLELRVLAIKGDGYYGPISKPGVYAICNSVVQAAATLQKRFQARGCSDGKERELGQQVKDLIEAGRLGSFHPLLLRKLADGAQTSD